MSKTQTNRFKVESPQCVSYLNVPSGTFHRICELFYVIFSNNFLASNIFKISCDRRVFRQTVIEIFPEMEDQLTYIMKSFIYSSFLYLILKCVYIAVQFTLQYSLHYSTVYITVQFTLKYSLHYSTVYITAQFTLQHSLHYSTVYITVQFTLQHSLHYGTVYITVHYYYHFGVRCARPGESEDTLSVQRQQPHTTNSWKEEKDKTVGNKK